MHTRKDDAWDEGYREAQIDIDQANAQIASAELALQIAQQNQVTHQEQIDNSRRSSSTS